ncbi:hypothetical protein [Priestia flexa]|nr:hypothetical protein [Priestia flexa]
MDFRKLVQRTEEYKKEHFAKIIAENERKLAEKRSEEKNLVTYSR